MSARLASGVSIVALALLLGVGSARAGPQGAISSAQAFGVRVVAPGGGATAGAISAPPQAAASLVSWSHAGAVSTGAISAGTEATRAGERAAGRAESSVSAVSLFGGEITADSVDLVAVAGAGGRGSSGRLAGSTVSGLTVLGRAVESAANARLRLSDWGYVVVLEQAVVSDSGARFGRRNFVIGLHVHLTADHGGLPAGSEILVGYAEAAASAPQTAPLPPLENGPVSPGANPPKSSKSPQEPVRPPLGANPAPPPIVLDPPESVRPQLTSGGYVFPVYGPASFTDDFRAGRASTGWHHGNDIFAALGAPLLAVADGTLALVGWNSIGGNRLWLRDDKGNEFYYAHLSAFSPAAVDGARVRAGDVIGFVGATGDALGTPPHLHFEIHPQQLLWMGYDGVINPYAYLLAWQRLQDASFDLSSWTPPTGPAPPPAAVLLEATDVSTASGLAPEGFAELLTMPTLFGEGPAAPKIVEAEPGFGQ